LAIGGVRHSSTGFEEAIKNGGQFTADTARFSRILSSVHRLDHAGALAALIAGENSRARFVGILLTLVL